MDARSDYKYLGQMCLCCRNPGLEKSIHTAQQKKLQDVLRGIRREANLRQIDLVELLGEPQSFVSKYENDERRLDILEIRVICQKVGISLEEFAGKLEEALKRQA